MTSVRLLGALLLLLGTRAVLAEPCKLTIEATDQMRYSTQQLTIPSSCSEVELTLRHSGKLSAKVMGHNWVLARASDMSAIVNAGLTAGSQNDFLPHGDARIIAATHVVGGGETSTATFSTSALQDGTRYAFFCTSPGHSAIMRGTVQFEYRKTARSSDSTPAAAITATSSLNP
ncbi:MAG: azurin [Sinobacteraceae bacterium]|nr:azurin [Nevskiaceae bacterium]MBV8852766.1 azurin [Nevskiaceae bacterium]MBV9914486.1 azurin [Nevskiaceae bacterium]